MRIPGAAFVLLLTFPFIVLPAGAAGVARIGIGGGADPATSQVSLEQDLRLARAVFGELLDPRDGREATCRRPQPGVDGPATPRRITWLP